MDLISKQEAKNKGLVRYFTGRPCLHGHVSERKTCSGNCYACDKLFNRKWKRCHKAERKRVMALQEKAAGRPRAHCCEIPGCPTVGKVVFDHCHKSKLFRGWICERCNRLLGQIKDDPLLLERLAAYLRKPDKSPLMVTVEDIKDMPQWLVKGAGIEIEAYQ